MKQRVVIETGTDGRFGAFAPDMQNAPIGTGDTVEETFADFLNSVKEMKESFYEDGMPVPEELNAEFVVCYTLSAFFAAFPCLNASKAAEAMGINASLMRQYSSGKARISLKRLHQIEEGLHAIGRQLQSITLTDAPA